MVTMHERMHYEAYGQCISNLYEQFEEIMKVDNINSTNKDRPAFLFLANLVYIKSIELFFSCCIDNKLTPIYFTDAPVEGRSNWHEPVRVLSGWLPLLLCVYLCTGAPPLLG
jgi:hypothetical protein